MYVAENKPSPCRYIPCSKYVNSLEQDVCEGLLMPPRSLPPKYFYDETGSYLFDRICDTPEYYPTRTESALLQTHAAELIGHASPEHILEFGSGSSRKTHHLLRACEQQNITCEYLPFDVCEAVLQQVHARFTEDYDWLDVKPLVGDYTAGLDYLQQQPGKCLYLFLGSSIGNFSVSEAQSFIAEVRQCMKTGDCLLLGVDRVKAPHVLHSAYNDAEGITGAFNLNVLNVLNKKLSADFDSGLFRHEAIYNADQQRIEMYLVSEQNHCVQLTSLGECIEFKKNEKILTEVSHKYTRDEAETLLTQSGLHILKHIEPDNAWFSLVLAGL